MTLKIRLAVLIAAQYIKRNWDKYLLSLAIVITLIFFAFKFDLLNSSSFFTEGFIGTYQEHDFPLEVKRLTSKGLVEAEKNGKVRPGLAVSWQVNNNATIFTFKLKPGIRWSDNTLIKSSDLDFGIADVEVTYPNDREVQFKLKESYSPFPTLLTKPLYKRGTLIGVGPYRIAKVEKSRIFITKIYLLPIDAKIPKIVVRFYPNEKTALTGFRLGEVESLFGAVNYGQIEETKQVQLTRKTDYSKIITVLFNTKDPLLISKPIRQALSYITPEIDKEAVANNPVSIFSWAYNSEVKKYLKNKETALQVLEKAKSTLSADTLKKEIILTATPNLEEAGRKIVSAWRQLGFDAKLRVESGIPQNFAALLIAQSIPIDPDQYFLWHSTQDKTNLTKYSTACCPLSARVDKDLEDGRKLITLEERKTKYLDFQKTLLEDAPAVFLYYPKYNILYLKKAKSSLDKLLPLQLSAQYN